MTHYRLPINGVPNRMRSPSVSGYEAQAQAIEELDPFFDTVRNLLHFNGVDGSTVFVDEKGFTVITHGSARIDTSISKYGGASGLFSRTTFDYIELPQINFGIGDFTIEGWVYLTSAFNDTIGICGQGSVYLAGFDNVLNFWQNGGFTYSFGSNPSINTWVHIAVSRVSGIIRLFKNGILVNTQSNAFDFSVSGSFNIGKAGDGGFNQYWNGNLDDFRINVGKGRYITSFTPYPAQFPDS